MDWRNIARPIIVIGLIVCVVLFGVYKVKNVYSGFMEEYKGTDSNMNGTSVEVTIPEETTIKEAAGILKDAGLIKYKLAFQLRMTGSQYSNSLQPGTYTLNTGMSTMDMIKTLCFVESTREVLYTLTVPEGFTVEQIADRCEELGFCSSNDFLKECQSGDFEYPFEIPSTEVKYALQGFLFPATYDIYDGMTPKDLIQDMIDKFNSVYTDDFKKKAEKLGYTDFEVLTMASIVEKECKLDKDRPMVAGVFINRLNDDMPLQVDPSVLYVVTDGQYNQAELTYDDLEVDSPYNTYKYTGLPVGPICNPGEASIEGVLNASHHNYLYYLTSDESEGACIFNETYEGHLADIEAADAAKADKENAEGDGSSDESGDGSSDGDYLDTSSDGDYSDSDYSDGDYSDSDSYDDSYDGE